jgi:hypothetical protein
MHAAEYVVYTEVSHEDGQERKRHIKVIVLGVL